MDVALQEALIDAVYRAALQPAAWHDVMQLMKRAFPSAAQAFYFLHLAPHRVQPVCLDGIEPGWLRSFDELYFAPDNPWMCVSPRLHQPGVVRTNERLDRFLNDSGVLYRSSYYNEWMRPQGLKYTIGNTLLAEGGIIANVTLLRPPDMKTFSAAEVRAFEMLSKHMARALQMAIRLQCPASSPASVAAFESMPHAVAVIDAQRRILYANPAMESLLLHRQGLTLQRGQLTATHSTAQPQFEAYVASALSSAGLAATAAAPLALPHDGQTRLTLHVVPMRGSMAPYLPWQPSALLVATRHADGNAVSRAAISQRFGCTPTEARLVQLIAEGRALREAAEAMGITYGTARVYLKIVFDKTGVGTQAQLVARVLGGAAAAPTARRVKAQPRAASARPA